jgi:hypothetical protein
MGPLNQRNQHRHSDHGLPLTYSSVLAVSFLFVIAALAALLAGVLAYGG